MRNQAVLTDAVQAPPPSHGRLALAVGCEFGFEATLPTTAVIQVAPALDPSAA